MSSTADLSCPVPLLPVTINKPWGREIWFTGMEARGESRVRVGGQELPLSAYLALNPEAIHQRTPVVLLKVLDPRNDGEPGNLYFEVHERKREVYVVTRVDPDAWPDGVGAIRHGMNQALRRRYGDDDQFRRAYLDAVQRYERIRRRLDARSSEHPGSPADPEDIQAEADLRKTMYAFTSMAPLRVGDVVQVAPWVPHSLQHGVQVVEFQTPTYERYILSFGQRVVTQDHWDTARAVARMSLDPPASVRPERVAPGIERIVRFDDFNAWRLRLEPGPALAPPTSAPYLVCMSVRGQLQVGPLTLQPGQAAFIPHCALGHTPLTAAPEEMDTVIALAAAPGI